MKLISLKEFQTITCLSDGMLIALLSSGKLTCQVAKNGSLMIDIQDGSLKQIVTEIRDSRASLSEAVITEVVEHTAPIIKTMIDEAFREAVIQAQERGILSPLASTKKSD